jgi:hypothetical protein
MKRLVVAVIAAGLLGQPGITAAQDNRLSTSVQPAAWNLAVIPPTKSNQSNSDACSLDPGWSAVRALPPAQEILITLKGQVPVLRYFVRVDNSDLIIVNPPDRARKQVLAFLLHDPENFESSSGIVDAAGHKIADLRQITERVHCSQLEEVAEPATSSGSLAGAAMGAAAGLGIGLYVGLGLSNRGDNALATLSLFGLPAAGGLIGFYGFHHTHPLRPIYKSGRINSKE